MRPLISSRSAPTGNVKSDLSIHNVLFMVEKKIYVCFSMSVKSSVFNAIILFSRFR